jgi:membrane-associated phospholipid phosphatase
VPCPSILFAFAMLACGDDPTSATIPKDTRLGASVQWNERAIALVVARQPTSNGSAAVTRILTYVSLAQYRAVVAAQAASGGSRPPSAAAAVGVASVVVLNSFFPLDVSATEAQLRSALAALTTPFDAKHDIAAGEALGRTVGTAVLAQAAQDNYLTVPVGTPPIGPEYWRSSSAPIARNLHGTKPFFLTTASQLRSPPPPAFGSATFNAALAEVRRISDTRTAEQTAIAVEWGLTSGTFTAGVLNLIADSALRRHNSNELEAARVLAVANAAGFDAQIACWDTKMNYWFIRPSQADTAIKLAIALPNHPSYPSGHSCFTAGVMGVLIDAFPSDRAHFEQIIETAGMSRVYAGIHYRFDIEAGRAIGLATAALALKGSLR